LHHDTAQYESAPDARKYIDDVFYWITVSAAGKGCWNYPPAAYLHSHYYYYNRLRHQCVLPKRYEFHPGHSNPPPYRHTGLPKEPNLAEPLYPAAVRLTRHKPKVIFIVVGQEPMDEIKAM
jgi:hypothetical protein